MPFKINLNPLPGAPYFTMAEHLRKFDGKNDVIEDLNRIELSLRLLFGIPPEYGFEIIQKNKRSNYFNDSVELILLDDPRSGGRFQVQNDANAHGKQVIDLSYSFPQIDENWSFFESLLIDTNASLGISNELIMLFSREKSGGIASIVAQKLNGRDIHLLARVLEDIKEKGMEMLVRESNYKAAVLYQMIESSDHLTTVSTKEKRSKTMVVAECDTAFLSQIQKLGYDLASYDNEGKTRITIANYPTQSKELIEMFADRLAAL